MLQFYIIVKIKIIAQQDNPPQGNCRKQEFQLDKKTNFYHFTREILKWTLLSMKSNVSFNSIRDVA